MKALVQLKQTLK